MKKCIWIILVILVLSACGQNKENGQEPVYVYITAQQAKEIMDSQENYIILDARTQEEYNESLITKPQTRQPMLRRFRCCLVIAFWIMIC